MTSIEAQVLCGKCRVPVQGPDDPDGGSMFACPECGSSDTHSNVMEEAAAYLRDTAARKIDKQMAAMARKSKFISVKGFKTPEREYRFITSKVL